MLEVGAALKTAAGLGGRGRPRSTTTSPGSSTTSCGRCRRYRGELSADARREEIDLLLDPLLDAGVPDGDRAALVIDVFRAVLAARVVPLFDTDCGAGVVTVPVRGGRSLVPSTHSW